MVIARLTLAASYTGQAALVISAFAMAAMVIARLTLATSYTGDAAFVITALAMPAMVITRLTFATSSNGVVTHAVIATMPPFAMTTAVITYFASDDIARTLVADLVTAIHAGGSAGTREGARAHALNGPSSHATVTRAHAHAGGTPAISFALVAGEQSESGSNNRHRRTN